MFQPDPARGPAPELARFAATLAWDDIPVAVRERVQVYLLDNLASGFVGAAQPWTAMVARLVEREGARGEATVFGAPWRTSAARAALVNGAAVHAFECDHAGHGAHPSGTCFPAALAVAEQRHASGRDFLTALTLGYEITVRVGAAQTNRVEVERGFHNPGANGPFGAAAAAGRLLGQGADTLTNALAISASSCGGLTEYAWQGEMTKRFHLGRVAQAGVEAALLAGEGFTGPATIFEGRFGFFNAFSPAPKPELLLDGLGERWLVHDITVKAHPSHMTSQALVEAIIAWREQQAVAPAAITRLHVRAVGRLTEERFLNHTPTTMLGAQYSLPYTLAVALARDLSDPLNLDESALSDETIRRLAAEMTIEPVAASAIGGAEAELVIAAGNQTHALRAGDFPGSPHQPLDLAGAAAKFRRYTGRLLTAAEQDRIIEMVSNLATLDDSARLAACLQPAAATV